MKKELIYKTVVLINQDDLSFIKETAQVIKENEFTLLVKHSKKNVFFLMIKSANQIPYADFNILSYKNSTNLQENLTNNLILLLDDRHELKEIKKLTRNHKMKIIYKENFLNELLNLKQNRTKMTHPSFFAENWSYFNNELTVECYLKEGLVSKKVVCNNTLLEIEEIISDKIYKAEEIFKENEELDYEFITDFNKIISDCQNEELLFENDQSSLENEENFLKEEIENNEEYEEINTKEYLNVHDLSNPSLQKCALENIFIPKNTKAFTNRVIKRNKIFFKNESVTLKFRKENLTNFSALFVNLFDVEGKMTVYNLNFNSKTEVKKEEFLLKNDILNFKITPIITKDKGYKVFLEEGQLKNGVFTFLGPLLICDKFKVNDFSCSLLDYSYRLIVQEKVKEGYPIKIYKKTVIIKGMFSSSAEVKAYKEYKLRTVNGSEGLIKDSLGGKGIFKAYFFKPVQSGEKIRLSLYKQVFLE